MHPIFAKLEASGFIKLDRIHPEAYRDKSGTAHTTYQRGPVRVSLAVQRVLSTMRNGEVMYCLGEPEDCWLKALLVEPAAQRLGHGTRVMQELTALADVHEMTLYVEPVALGDLTQVHMIGFYGRFGFEPQNDLYRVMVREPGAVGAKVRHEALAG